MDSKMFVREAASVLGVSTQAVHKKIKYHNLKVQKMSNKSYFGHNEARALFGLNFSPKIVACQIVKGGVGKTTLVHNLAVRANLYGARVLLVDLDQQANLTESMKVDVQDKPVMIDIVCGDAEIKDAIVSVAPGLDIIPSAIENSVLDNKLRNENFPLDRVYKRYFDKILDNYDIILVDCPPALGPSVGAIALTADLILSPINPDRYSLSGLKIIYEQFTDLEHKFDRTIMFKIVMNKFNNTNLSHDVYEGIYGAEIFRDKIMKTQIQERQEFKNKDARGKTIFSTSKETVSKENIDSLTRELFDLNSQLKSRKSSVNVDLEV